MLGKERTTHSDALVILAEMSAHSIRISFSKYFNGALHIKHSSFISFSMYASIIVYYIINIIRPSALTNISG